MLFTRGLLSVWRSNGGAIEFLRFRPHLNNRITCAFSQLEEVTFTREKHEKIWPLVKMCGITSAKDAAMAAQARANSLAELKELNFTFSRKGDFISCAIIWTKTCWGVCGWWRRQNFQSCRYLWSWICSAICFWFLA